MEFISGHSKWAEQEVLKSRILEGFEAIAKEVERKWVEAMPWWSAIVGPFRLTVLDRRNQISICLFQTVVLPL